MGFTRFFRSAKTPPRYRDKNLFIPLEEYARKAGHAFYSDSDLYYHNRSVPVPFLLLDRYRGIYLFDSAPWNLSDLKHLKAEKAPLEARQPKDVDVDTAHRLIDLKLDETLNRNDCEVCNFLYLPQLKQSDFDRLDESFQELIPKSRAIFADDDETAIEQKLSQALQMKQKAYELSEIAAALFLQYALLPDKANPFYKRLTPQQQCYVDAPLGKHSLLIGANSSGKSAALLLKALYHKLRHPEQEIVIIQPTVAAAELMTQQLLELLEYGVVHIDPTSIRITSPQQVCREHYIKVHRAPPVADGHITDKMFEKKTDLADFLFIDDAHLLDSRQMKYFKHLQQRRGLHISASDSSLLETDDTFTLQHSFRQPYSLASYPKKSSRTSDLLSFHEGNAYILTLHLLPEILQHNRAEDILIVTPDETFARRLFKEVTDFIGSDLTLFDPHKTLLNQNMEQLLIAPMGGLSGLSRKQLIVIYDDNTDSSKLSHAIGRAEKEAVIIYHTSE